MPLKSSAWIFLVLMIVALALAVRARLASMPLERDEGEYAYMGRLLLEGVPPYREAYAMKFPGIYAAYAGILSVFGQTATGLRWGLMGVNAATIGILFALARRLAKLGPSSGASTSIGLGAAAAYAVASLLPSALGLTANAEHFVLLPALAGFLLLVPKRMAPPSLGNVLWGGICLGLASCVKQQGLAFAALGFFWMGVLQTRKADSALRLSRSALVPCLIYGLGVALVWSALGIGMACAGVWEPFWFWCWEYARHYGGMWTIQDGLRHFGHTGGAVWSELGALFWIALWGWFRIFTQNRIAWWAATAWIAAGFLAMTPGLIFRPHYWIFMLPGLALAWGFGCAALGRWRAVGFLTLFVPLWMGRQILWFDDPEQANRRLYPNNGFCETRAMGEWLKTTIPETESMAVLGSEPQIYFDAGRRAAIPYLYMYPLLEPHPLAHGMQQDLMRRLETHPPRYLVHVRIPTSWLAYPNSDMTLLNWLPTFLKKNYAPIQSISIPGSHGQIDGREITAYRLQD